MRKQEIKTINQTFSLPIGLSADLHAYIKTRERSRFVSQAIRKELELKKEELKNAYMAANKDEGQIEALEDWQSTLSDGLDE